MIARRIGEPRHGLADHLGLERVHQHDGSRVVHRHVAVLAIAHHGNLGEGLLLRFVFRHRVLLRQRVVAVDDTHALLDERGQLVAPVGDHRRAVLPRAACANQDQSDP